MHTLIELELHPVTTDFSSRKDHGLIKIRMFVTKEPVFSPPLLSFFLSFSLLCNHESVSRPTFYFTLDDSPPLYLRASHLSLLSPPLRFAYPLIFLFSSRLHHLYLSHSLSALLIYFPPIARLCLSFLTSGNAFVFTHVLSRSLLLFMIFSFFHYHYPPRKMIFCNRPVWTFYVLFSSLSWC